MLALLALRPLSATLSRREEQTIADASDEHSTRLAMLRLFRQGIVRSSATGLAAILVFTPVAAQFAAEAQPAAKVYRVG
ncbi:MAG TPA: hypothetical protein VGT00_01605, partial [Methylomirabilota bacterium]|nr:hypothetical protein [Methylomirabilota bacterium]